MKILKHKKIIAFLLIFSLSFGVVTDYKQKQAHAVAVVDDITLIVLGLTVVATGVMATRNSQVKHMGSMLWDRLVDVGVTGLEQISRLDNNGNRQILMTNVVKECAVWVAENLPKLDIFQSSDNIVGQSFIYTSDKVKSSPLINGVYGPFGRITLLNPGPTIYGKGVLSEKGSTTKRYTINIPYGAKYMDLYYNSSTKTVYGITDLNDTKIRISNSSYSYSPPFEITDMRSLNNINEEVGEISIGNMVSIPYSNEKIKENYNPTVINTRLPWNVGIDELKNGTQIGTIGTNAPVIDRVINGDITDDTPLVWDDVKDYVTDKVISGDIVTDEVIDDTVTGDDTITGDGTISGTITDTVDNIFNNETKSKLDFSPLYMSFSDKFPFCLPFDFSNIIKSFNATQKEPVFFVDMSGFSSQSGRSNLGFEIDLTKFDILFKVCRTFTLISFSVFLMLKTRDIIKG